MDWRILGIVAGIVGCAPDLGKGGGASGKDDGAADTGGGTVDSGTDSAPPVDTDPPLTLVADDEEAWRPLEEVYAANGVATISEDGATLDGVVTYSDVRDDQTECDLDIALSGTSYEGICEDCDFAFALDPEIAEERAAEDCSSSSRWTFLPTDNWVNPVLAFASSIEMPDPFTDQWGEFTNVMFLSFDPGNEDAGYVPYYDPIVFTSDDHSSGEASYGERTLSWSLYGVFEGSTEAEYGRCGIAKESSGTEPYSGNTVEGSLSCPGSYADGWAVEATAGDTFFVSADTVDFDTAFLPTLLVNRPDGCTVLRAESDYFCSFGIPGYTENCPTGSFVADTSGTYVIWVFALSPCWQHDEGVDAKYTLTVDRLGGASAPRPVVP